MTLQEAWYNIIGMDNVNTLSSAHIFSILSDYGVFTAFPKLKIAVKTALSYGLWDLVITTYDSQKVAKLKIKLENDGFSNDVIESIITSFSPDSAHIMRSKKDVNINIEPNPNVKLNSRSEMGLPFKLGNGIKEDVTSIPASANKEIIELNQRLYVIPQWNHDASVVVNELYISDKEVVNNYNIPYPPFLNPNKGYNAGKCFCLSYNITGDSVKFQEVKFYLLIITNDCRIYSKEWVTRINLKDKYAITTGEYALNLNIPIAEIEAIVLVPEIGDLDIADVASNKFTYADNSFKNLKRLNCAIDFEETPNSYPMLNIQLSNFRAWGKKHKLSIDFVLNGYGHSRSGYMVGNKYVIAIFNKFDKLAETHNLFIGKTGYIGPRGGIHDTYMSGGKIQSLYLTYLDTKIEVSEISRIIITLSN